MSIKDRFLSYMKASPSMPWLTEVEWLHNDYDYSSGSVPYIDTGIKNNWDVPFEMSATITKTSANRIIVLGNYSGNLTNFIEVTVEGRLRIYITASTSIDPSYIARAFYTDVSTPIPLNVPTKIWVKYIPLNDADHTINYEMGLEALDGSVSNTNTGSFYRSGSSTRNIQLFMDSRPNNQDFDGGFKMHQCEIKNGTVHKKFIPCLDLNRVPCMYEQVDGKLYYNSGTGGFNVGRRITEVEWIHLTGKQYFNTGFKPNTLSTTLKTKYTFEGTAMMLGCRISATYPQMCSIYMPAGSSTRPYSRIRLDWMTGESSMFTNYFDSEVVELEITGNYAKANGVEYTDTTKTSLDMTDAFRIGCAYTTSGSNHYVYPQTGKVYYNELLQTYTRESHRYCVPAHDENNVGFFFDRINHFIMDNEGTGTDELTWGDEIHPVSYLYGGAPSRFNTGITFYDHAWETDVKYNSVRSDLNLMGATTGACNYWGVYESDSQYAKTYTLHTSSADYGLTIDPTETRTVSLDMGLDTDNTNYKITMTIEGESVDRTASTVNTTTGYRITNFANNYPEPAYLYGNRCYNRSTKELVQNLVPVQNGQKVSFLFNTLNHTMTGTINNVDEFKKGSDVVGYKLDSQLPYGLVEVDYLESTGTQYLNTGITPTNTMGIDVTYAYPTISNSTNAGVCGTYQGTRPRTDAFFVSTMSGTTNANILLGNAGVAKNTATIATANTWINAKINWLNDGLLNLNNGTVTDTMGSNTIESNKLIIFGRVKASDSSIACGVERIRRYRMTDGSRISHDYVPCLRIYDNKPGMFDLITRQFLTNQGTGEFIVGIDGVGYAPVDYLESTGPQWIDTGIQMQANYGVEIEAKQTSQTTGVTRYLFGDAPASAGRYLIFITSGANIFRLGLDALNKDSNVSGYDEKYHIHKVENKTYFIDGVSQGSLNAPNFTGNRNARLFSVATTSTLVDNYWQIKRCTIKDENDNKLANFIPLVRVSDSKPGMFDLVSRTLCVNGAGGADFTVVAR